MPEGEWQTFINDSLQNNIISEEDWQHGLSILMTLQFTGCNLEQKFFDCSSRILCMYPPPNSNMINSVIISMILYCILNCLSDCFYYKTTTLFISITDHCNSSYERDERAGIWRAAGVLFTVAALCVLAACLYVWMETVDGIMPSEIHAIRVGKVKESDA